MKTKNTITTLLILLISLTVSAQKIKFKKGNVLLDGKVILKYERESWGVNKMIYSSLESEDEILEINQNDNETDTYYDDDFIQVKFLETGKMAEFKSDKSFKGLLKWLIKKKVLTTDGKVNDPKLDLFIKNYDENITNRTIRRN